MGITKFINPSKNSIAIFISTRDSSQKYIESQGPFTIYRLLDPHFLLKSNDSSIFKWMEVAKRVGLSSQFSLVNSTYKQKCVELFDSMLSGDSSSLVAHSKTHRELLCAHNLEICHVQAQMFSPWTSSADVVVGEIKEDDGWLRSTFSSFITTFASIPSKISNFFSSLFREALNYIAEEGLSAVASNIWDHVWKFFNNRYIKLLVHFCVFIYILHSEFGGDFKKFPVATSTVFASLVHHFVTAFPELNIVNGVSSIISSLLQNLNLLIFADFGLAQAGSASIPSIITVVLTCVFTLLAPSMLSSNSYILPKIALFISYVRDYKSISSAIRILFNGIKFVANEVAHWLGYGVIFEMTKDVFDRVGEFVIKGENELITVDFAQYSDLVRFGVLIDLISECEILLQEAHSYKYQSAALNSVYQRLLKRKSAIEAFLNSSKKRCEPVSVMLYGAPGVGKTNEIASLSAFVAGCLNYTGQPSWSKSAKSDYWDGYRYQPVVKFDDVFSINEAESTSILGEDLLHIMSSDPYHLNMAGVDDKASYYFDSPFVVCTSNYDFEKQPSTGPALKHNFMDANALFRRFQIQVRVTQKDNHPCFEVTNIYSPSVGSVSEKFKALSAKYLSCKENRKFITREELQMLVWTRYMLHQEVFIRSKDQVERSIIHAKTVGNLTIDELMAQVATEYTLTAEDISSYMACKGLSNDLLMADNSATNLISLEPLLQHRHFILDFIATMCSYLPPGSHKSFINDMSGKFYKIDVSKWLRRIPANARDVLIRHWVGIDIPHPSDYESPVIVTHNICKEKNHDHSISDNWFSTSVFVKNKFISCNSSYSGCLMIALSNDDIKPWIEEATNRTVLQKVKTFWKKPAVRVMAGVIMGVVAIAGGLWAFKLQKSTSIPILEPQSWDEDKRDRKWKKGQNRQLKDIGDDFRVARSTRDPGAYQESNQFGHYNYAKLQSMHQRYHGNKAQGLESSTTAIESLYANVDQITVSTENRSFIMHGIFVMSGVFLTVAHLFATCMRDDSHDLSGVTIKFEKIDLEVKEFEIVTCDDQDLCIVLFAHPKHKFVKDIFEKFMNDDDVSARRPTETYTLINPQGHQVRMQREISCGEVISYFSADYKNFHTYNYIEFLGKSEKGWCGLPYIYNFSYPKIVAVHVAGSRQMVIGSLVTQELILKMVKSLCPETESKEIEYIFPALMTKTVLEKSILKTQLEGEVIQYSKQKTVIYTTTKVPALRSLSPQGDLDRIRTERIALPKIAYEDALHYLRSQYSSKYKSFVLSFVECLYGSPGNLIPGVTRDSSMGYPHNLSYSGKRDFIFDDGYVVGLETSFNDCVDRMRKPFPSMWEGVVTSCPKDESLREGKAPRWFYLIPQELNLAFKSYFGCVYTMFFSTHETHPVSLGINPYKGFESLYRKLKNQDYIFFDFDQTWQDVTMHEKDLMFLADWLFAMDQDESLYTVRKNILYNLSRMPLAANGSFVDRTGINLSGHTGTSMISSIGSILVVAYLIRTLFETTGVKYNPDFLSTNMTFFVYGDDIILGIKKQYADLPWDKSIQLCAKFNRKLTPGDKMSTEIAPKALTDCTYLKRHFVNSSGMILAPLDLNSLFEMFGYVQKGGNDFIGLSEIYRTAMIEAAMHGSTFYNSYCEVLERAFSKITTTSPYRLKWANIISNAKNMDSYKFTQFSDHVLAIYSAEARNLNSQIMWKRMHGQDFSMVKKFLVHAQMMEVMEPNIEIVDDGTDDPAHDDTSSLTSKALENKDPELPQPETLASSMFNITSVEGQEVYTFWPRTFSSRDYLSYDSPNLSKLLRRRILWSRGNWTSAQTGVIESGTLSPTFDHPSFKCRLTNYSLVRFDVAFTIVINATRFHVGQLLFKVLPYQSTVDSWYGTNRSSYFVPNTIISANTTTTCTVVCPWFHPHPWIRLSDIEHYLTVHLEVFQGLTAINQNASSSVSWQIYVELRDLQVQAPYPDPFEAQMKSIIRPDVSSTTVATAAGDVSASVSSNIVEPVKAVANQQLAATSEAVTKARDSLLVGVKQSADTGTRKVGDMITNVIGKSTDAMYKMFSLGGLLFDKPFNFKVATPVYQSTMFDYTNCDGVMNGNKYSLKLSSTIPPSTNAVCSFSDELSIGNIISKPGLVMRFTVDSSHPYFTQVFSVPIGPMCGNSTNQMFSPLSWVASHFRYWRGSIRFTIMFAASQFASGKFRICMNPYDTIAANEETLSDAYSQLIEIKGETTFNVDIPYVDSHAWKLIPGIQPDHGAFGYLQMYIVNPIAEMDTTSDSSVKGAIFINGNPDVQFAVPFSHTSTSPNSLTLPLVGNRPPAEAQVSVRGFASRPWNPISHSQVTHDDGFIVGEQIESMKQLLMRFYYWKSATVGATFAFPIDLNAPELEAADYPSAWHEMTSPFLFVRGSYRLKFIRRGSGDIIIMNQDVDYADAAIIGTGKIMWPDAVKELTVEILPYINSINTFNCVHVPSKYFCDPIRIYMTCSSATGIPVDIHISAGDDFNCGFFVRTPFWVAPAPLGRSLPPPSDSFSNASTSSFEEI